ncbi:MAG: hypothetical protein AB7E75_05035 [Candidatus Methanomethylophilaceae archaeon]
MKVPAGIQPRQSIGFMIGYISKMIDRAAGTDVSGLIRDLSSTGPETIL